MSFLDDIMYEVYVLCSPRGLVESVREFKRSAQKEFESIARGINDDFGDTVAFVHEVENALDDMFQNTLDTVGNVGRACSPEEIVIALFGDDEKPRRGDHIYVTLFGFSHHAIYMGDGYVMHYTGDLDSGVSIRRDTLEAFAQSGTIRILPKWESPTKYSTQEICNRAWQRYAESSYNLIFNNCENFARWCRCGSAA